MKVTCDFQVFMEVLNEMVAFEERPKGRVGTSHVDI